MIIRLHGRIVNDLSTVYNGLDDTAVTFFMAVMVSASNMVGSSIAGIYPQEHIDT